MAITVECECGKSFDVTEKHAGKTLKCPGCGQGVVVPIPGLASIDTSEPPLKPEPPKSLTAAPRPPRGFWSALGDAFSVPPLPPDRRTLDTRRHDELMEVLNGIRSRLTWLVVLAILVTIGSCSAGIAYQERAERMYRSRF